MSRIDVERWRIRMNQNITFWNYHKIQMSDDNYDLLKYYDNINDMITYGILLLFFTMLSIPCAIIAATLPFQSGEGNFILAWLTEIVLILLNISYWKKHFEYKRKNDE